MATSEHDHEITPVRTYLMIYAGLMVLLVLTVMVGFIKIGPFNKAIALTIASVKAGLIMVYFMHLNHSSKLVWVFAVMGFVMLVIMVLLTMGDYLARGTIVGPLG